jgi:hypothetical protein
MAVGFVSQLLLAPLADRGHSKTLLLAGLVAAITGSLIFAASSSLVMLVIARAVVGCSNGLFLPAARAIAASMSDEGVGERLGTLGGVELAGFVTGPVIGGVLVGPLGVRWPFLVCGAFALVALVALVPRSLPAPPIAPHAARLGLDLLRLRPMQVGVLFTMALFFPVGMYDAILDRYMTDRGASNLLVGLGFLMYGIPFALLATTGGRLSDRHGAFRTSMISLLLVAPLTAAYGLIEALDDHGHALAAADAHRLDAERLVGLLEAVDQRGHDAGAGHAERVAEGDGAAVHVELVPGMPSCLADGMTCAAKASLISTRSMSSMVMPARPSAWRQASTGPRPMISGLRPDTPDDTMRASGVRPSSLALVSLITSTAAAPSLSGQALPAVTVPSGRNTGLRPESLDGGAGADAVVLR